jgi:hypothetical protein
MSVFLETGGFYYFPLFFHTCGKLIGCTARPRIIYRQNARKSAKNPNFEEKSANNKVTLGKARANKSSLMIMSISVPECPTEQRSEVGSTLRWVVASSHIYIVSEQIKTRLYLIKKI